MVIRLLLYLFFAVFFLIALSIPLAFQSMTLWYKYGVDRVLLQSAQLSGIIAFVLIYLQIILATRGKLMEKAFGVARLMKWHKLNGVLITIFAFAHILLVLLPEGLGNLPLGLEFWPELIGIFLILILFFMVTTSRYRQLMPLSYGTWRIIHRSLGYLAILLVSSHMFFVSDSFENFLPKLFLLISFLGLFLWVLVVKWLSSNAKSN